MALLISMAVFNIIVVPLPLQIADWTSDLYDFVETLGPNDFVLVTTNLGAGQLPECYDTHVMMLRHFRARGVKLVEVSTGGPWGGGMTNIPIGLTMWAEAFDVTSIENAPEYGESIVFLGYLPGEYGGASTISFANDLRSIYDKDYFGNSISGMPFLDDVNTITDFSMVMGLGASYTGIDVYMTAEWTVPAAWATTAQYTADIAADYRIGRYTGAIIGNHGGAEYEALMGAPGPNMLRLSAVFMVCVSLFILIGVSNIRFVLLPRLSGKASNKKQEGET